jgi:hypothetical protein
MDQSGTPQLKTGKPSCRAEMTFITVPSGFRTKGHTGINESDRTTYVSILEKIVM